MNSLNIIFSYLKARKLNVSIHILMLAFAVTLMTVLIHFGSQLQSTMQKDASGIDVVIGAKGSPMQLVLSSVYHADIPTGNIPYEVLHKLENNRNLDKLIPLALGDNFKGFRIVGTTHDYPNHYAAKLSQGELWQDSMQAVIGADVAAETGMKLGDKFAGSHGLSGDGHAHEGDLYTIVGVLEKNDGIVDRLILTSLESVWDIHSEEEHEQDQHEEDEHKHKHHGHSEHKDEYHHEHKKHEAHEQNEDKEITAILASYKNKAAAMNFPRYINSKTNYMAASPAFETARLFELVGFSTDALMLVASIILGISLLGVFISLLNSVFERKYDIAVMRTLGASKAKIFTLIIGEALVVGLLGAFIGLVLGHVLLGISGEFIQKSAEFGISGLNFKLEEIWLLIAISVLAVISSLIPAYLAYKNDIVKTLAKHG